MAVRWSVAAVVERLLEAQRVVRGTARAGRLRAAIVLTAAGRAVLERAPAPPTALLVKALRGLPERRARSLAEGLTALVDTIEQIKAGPNPGLEIDGILRTMFDPRNNLSNEVSAQLIEHFREKVFRTIIPRNVRLAEAPSYGKPALHYDRESRGALAYLALAGEMIRREEGDYELAGAGLLR
jgi:cellulose biosynthesis protein BcsQ